MNWTLTTRELSRVWFSCGAPEAAAGGTWEVWFGVVWLWFPLGVILHVEVGWRWVTAQLILPWKVLGIWIKGGSQVMLQRQSTCSQRGTNKTSDQSHYCTGFFFFISLPNSFSLRFFCFSGPPKCFAMLMAPAGQIHWFLPTMLCLRKRIERGRRTLLVNTQHTVDLVQVMLVWQVTVKEELDSFHCGNCPYELHKGNMWRVAQ